MGGSVKTILLLLVFVTTPNHTWNSEQITRAIAHTNDAAEYWRGQGIADFQIARTAVLGKVDFPNHEWQTELDFYNNYPRDRMTMYWTRECHATESGTLYNGWTMSWVYVVSKQCDLPWDATVVAHEMGHWFWRSEAELDEQIAAYADSVRK